MLTTLEIASVGKPTAALVHPPRIAIVHDWFPAFRGGERVVAEICKVYPGSDIFTLFDFLPDEIKKEYFAGANFFTSPVNRLPGVAQFYRALFFLCPFLIEQFDVTGYDIVISSSAAFARGVLTRPDQPHICYVHSPVRYAWDEQFSYLAQGGLGFGPKGLLFRYLLYRLRGWDTRTAHSPDVMFANSNYVRARVRRVYGREAQVLFPPVDVEQLPYLEQKDDYFVTASFLAPYKRTDLVIEAFNKMPEYRLVVVGEGQQSKELRALAGPNIHFAGHLPRPEYETTIARARAMVFAGCEDFGIVLAEAQACGTPLIAFGRGGARDIVRCLRSEERPTGLLFDHQAAAAVEAAVKQFVEHQGLILPEHCRRNSLRFSSDRFRQRIREGVDAAVLLKREMNTAP